MSLNKKGKKIMEKMKEEYGKKKGESVFYAMENSGKLKGVKKAKKGMMTNLKPVPAGKEKSLGKLPPEVRNRMGYAKYGKMMKANNGLMAEYEEFKKNKIKKLRGAQVGPMEELKISQSLPSFSEFKKNKIKKLRGAQVGPMEEKRIMDGMSKKSIGGSMKKGYGQARTSGMGLEDESLVPGKGYEYIKDLI